MLISFGKSRKNTCQDLENLWKTKYLGVECVGNAFPQVVRNSVENKLCFCIFCLKTSDSTGKIRCGKDVKNALKTVEKGDVFPKKFLVSC